VSLGTPVSVSATDGTVAGNVTVTWAGVSGASGYDLQYRVNGTGPWTSATNVTSGWQLSTADQSTYEFQVRAKNVLGTGSWSGSDTGYIARSCSTTGLNWGGGNFCSATANAASAGAVQSLTNATPGASGGATATCNGVTANWNLSGASCSATLNVPTSVSATDGTVAGKVTVTWANVPYATSYDVQYRVNGTGPWTSATNVTSGWQLSTADQSTYEFQVRAGNGAGTGAWSGSDTGYIARSCSTTALNWGSSNFCGATANAASAGTSLNLTNATLGASGGATATCNGVTANWDLSGTACSVNLATINTLTATQGTVVGAIQLSWAAISGASSFDIQYRKQGDINWSYATNISTTNWVLTTTDESIYEFQVRGSNPVGQGAWSNSATGYVRAAIMPVFVSQSAVPTDLFVGQSFSVTQTWKNAGFETWTTDGTYYLSMAPGSGDFGANNAIFSTSVAQDQTGTNTLSLTAPSTPGSYIFSRKFMKSGAGYGGASTPANIKVWGNPTCGSMTVSQPITYDLNGTITVKFTVNDQTTSASAQVWSDVNGTDDLKGYTPTVTAGVYQFAIPIANHSGYGMYHAKVNVSNVLASGSCEIQFELRQLAQPVVSLTDIVGKGNANEFVVGQTKSTPIITANATRSDNLALAFDVLDGSGNLVSTTPMNSGASAVTLPGDRWTGAAWGKVPYTLNVRYSDPGAASQNAVLSVPIQLILSPAGNTLSLTYSTVQPLIATTTMGQSGGGQYDPGAQGEWLSKVAVQGGSDLDTLTTMGASGSNTHTLSYDSLYGKTLVATARANPPSGIILESPFEITTSAKIPVLPVLNLSATDGTMEDVVRVTWGTPAVGGSGFRFDLYRDDTLIQASMSGTQYDDTPPQRGQQYTYKVVAILSTDRSDPVSDTGFVPTCRAARLLGASLNADMSAINGLLESWACLTSLSSTSAIDAVGPVNMPTAGTGNYRSFSVPVPSSMPDGSHVLHLDLESGGVTINASRVYDVPFNLNRASIAVNNMTIIYDGAPVQDGQTATSIGRFGVKMDGGNGIGFAVPIQ
jgi:hypothetical protein